VTATYRDAKRTRDERTGASFKPDQRFERLHHLTAVERDAIFEKAPGLRTSFGYYVSAREAALESALRGDA